MFLTYLIVFILLAPMVIYTYRYCFSKMKTGHCSRLDPDATIVGIRSENDDWGRDRFIKTIVTFSDGSEYHTHKARRELSFGGFRQIVDAEVIKEISEAAVIAHQKKVGKIKP